jgi:predicted  nucleic acid-binding Zn-ribbon protein
MLSDLALLQQIQALDNRIDELNRELSHLPVHVAEIESKLASHKQELEGHKQALAENEKERRQLEGAASEHDQKAKKLEEQITEARTNEQYRAFRAEIAFARKEVQKAEDVILDKMEQAEALRVLMAESEKALAEESEVVAGEVEEMKGRFKGDEEELAKVSGERAELAKGANAHLLRVYDGVRHRLRQRAISPIAGARCTSCNMTIRPQLLQQLRAADKIVQCEFCKCIIYDPETVAEPVPAEDPAGDAGAA